MLATKKENPLYNSTRFFFAQEDPNGPKMFSMCMCPQKTVVGEL